MEFIIDPDALKKKSSITLNYGNGRSIKLEPGMTLDSLLDLLKLAYSQGYEAAELALKSSKE